MKIACWVIERIMMIVWNVFRILDGIIGIVLLAFYSPNMGLWFAKKLSRYREWCRSKGFKKPREATDGSA